MKKRENCFEILCIIMAIGVIISAVVGIFYSTEGQRFTITNMYGNTVELYGDGVYAYNSVLTVANRLGADINGIIAAIILITSVLWKRETILREVIQTSMIVYLTYHLACLTFGISMNSLYFLYVICFGISLFTAIAIVGRFLNNIGASEIIRTKKMTGVGIFLIIVGLITAMLWISSIIPAIVNNSYGVLLGIQTTEVTFGIDLAITCPAFVTCGVWILRKKEIGYKVAPILLNMMVAIAILVICQRAYCAKLGINIPIGALIGFIISFIIMGIISLFLAVKLIRGLTKV